MAQVKVTLTYCDVCGEESKDGTRYEIRQGTRRRQIDLCTKDAKTLEDLMEQGSTKTPRGATPAANGAKRGRKPRGGVKATTLEDIEASKAKAK